MRIMGDKKWKEINKKLNHKERGSLSLVSVWKTFVAQMLVTNLLLNLVPKYLIFDFANILTKILDFQVIKAKQYNKYSKWSTKQYQRGNKYPWFQGSQQREVAFCTDEVGKKCEVC